jgi:hypothetical protein
LLGRKTPREENIEINLGILFDSISPMTTSKRKRKKIKGHGVIHTENENDE